MPGRKSITSGVSGFSYGLSMEVTLRIQVEALKDE
jgi:hypothetical protein